MIRLIFYNRTKIWFGKKDITLQQTGLNRRVNPSRSFGKMNCPKNLI